MDLITELFYKLNNMGGSQPVVLSFTIGSSPEETDKKSTPEKLTHDITIQANCNFEYDINNHTFTVDGELVKMPDNFTDLLLGNFRTHFNANPASDIVGIRFLESCVIEVDNQGNCKAFTSTPIEIWDPQNLPEKYDPESSDFQFFKFPSIVILSRTEECLMVEHGNNTIQIPVTQEFINSLQIPNRIRGAVKLKVESETVIKVLKRNLEFIEFSWPRTIEEIEFSVTE